MYRLGLVMGQHVEIFAKHIGDADIIARFRADSYAWLVLPVLVVPLLLSADLDGFGPR